MVIILKEIHLVLVGFMRKIVSNQMKIMEINIIRFLKINHLSQVIII
jgi:hypothetical protein